MSATTDTFARFVDVLAETLDDHYAAGETLASRVHLARFHFDRLVSAAAGEPPATFHRRVLLERAAYRLITTDDELLQIAFRRRVLLARGIYPRVRTRVRAGTLAVASAADALPDRRAEPGALQPTRGPARPRSEKGHRPGSAHPHDPAPRLADRRDDHPSRRSDRRGVLDSLVEISVDGIDDNPTLRSRLSRLVGQLAM